LTANCIPYIWVAERRARACPAHFSKAYFTSAKQFRLFWRAAEVTVECAPGTLSSATLETLVADGVIAVSLECNPWWTVRQRRLDDCIRVPLCSMISPGCARRGIHNINIDLIAGLAHQSAESWDVSLNEVIATGVPHVSVTCSKWMMIRAWVGK